MAKKRANGEGNIRKRADGRWEGRYTAGYHPETGKRIIKNVLGKTQAECKAKLSAAMEATRGIDVSRADEYTVATWLRSWYEIYAKPNIRISTANRYQLMVEQYTIPRIGNIKLTKLTSRDLQKLYKDLMENGRIDRKSGHGNPGLSSTTVRSLHLMLHSALERAVKERLILRNPTEDCIAPKVQKVEMQILPPEHIKDYLEAADRRGLLPMFYLELVTGLRKGEITALLWSDLDTLNKTISVSKQYVKNPNGELTLSRPKTETSVRKVSIPQEAVDLLIAEHSKHPENPYMFPSPATGEMYYPDSVVNLHKKILKDAGLPHIRFHDLRHTFATLALQNGVDVKTVSSMLGTTTRASHSAPTPTQQGKSRTRPHKRWAASWRRSCKQKKAKNTGEKAKASSPVLFGSIGIFPRVGQGVGQAVDPHFDPHHFQRFCNKKAPKTEVFDAFWSCWADSNCRPHPYQSTNLISHKPL